MGAGLSPQFMSNRTEGNGLKFLLGDTQVVHQEEIFHREGSQAMEQAD